MLLVAVSFTSCSAQKEYSLPESFKGTQENVIINAEALSEVFRLLNDSTKEVRVMQCGDSHVQGHVLPKTLGERLKAKWSNVSFQYLSKNGVRLNWFLDEERLSQIGLFNPHFLVLSLGTNEAHGNFKEETYRDQLDRFVQEVRRRCPGVTIMLTTAPGSHIAKTKGATKVPNDVNSTVADCQVRYCRDRNMAVWDLYNIAGGKANACNNWRKAGMMQADLVHYRPQTYALMSNLLADAIEAAALNTNNTITDFIDDAFSAPAEH